MRCGVLKDYSFPCHEPGRGRYLEEGEGPLAASQPHNLFYLRPYERPLWKQGRDYNKGLIHFLGTHWEQRQKILVCAFKSFQEWDGVRLESQ